MIGWSLLLIPNDVEFPLVYKTSLGFKNSLRDHLNWVMLFLPQISAYPP